MQSKIVFFLLCRYLFFLVKNSLRPFLELPNIHKKNLLIEDFKIILFRKCFCINTLMPMRILSIRDRYELRVISTYF